MKLLKYFHTLKYLGFNQTFGRLYSIIRRKLNFAGRPAVPSDLKARINPKIPFPPHDPWNKSDDIAENIFVFLARQKRFGSRIDWNDTGMPLLWNYNLHYFDFLHVLDPEQQRRICLDWIENNEFGKGIGWSPYPLSLRIVNWIKTGLNDSGIVESIYEQTEFLSRNMEFYHPGNHYLENAKALVFSGFYFKEDLRGMEWTEKGLKILEKEIPKQVLYDGVYFERTPMYHSIMLRGFLDLLNILPRDHDFYEVLKSYIKKMGHFLVSSTHPNGDIALFNDSAVEIALPPAKLEKYFIDSIGEPAPKKSSFPEAGFFIFGDRQIYIIIDGGKIGPDELPAHSHADIFSYELSIKGRKVIVDTGVFEYSRGEIRNIARSTGAHNTVAVDRISQAECWDSFRVARRFDPENVEFRIKDGSFEFKGDFGGYSRLIGDNIIHKRKISYLESAGEIEVTDTIEGRGEHLIESYIHLHPSVQFKFDPESGIVEAGQFSIAFEKASLKIVDTWYSERFGIMEDNKTIVAFKQEPLPAELTYRIKIGKQNKG